MLRKILIILLFSIVIADVVYTFLQNYYMPFDGDMAGGIVPAEDVKLILENPLGIKVFIDQVTYPNPNRFFCHWSFYKYFNTVPLLFQSITSPINSAYLSCALVKTVIQLIIIIILSLYVSGGVFKLDFLVAATLITPLFQTNGYRSYMGIIDPSTTYTFFYAFPTIFILIYFAPIFFNQLYGMEFNKLRYLKYLWIPLALVSSLSGPLNPGVSLIICLFIFVYYFYYSLNYSDIQDEFTITRIKTAIQKIPGEIYFYLFPICLFSAYSLFLGRYNSVDLSHPMSFSVLYSRIPIGVYYIFTQKLGFPVLILILIINVFIIRRNFFNMEGKKILNSMKWIVLFAIVYILLLPLGGYRTYRPYVVRYDTIIPITLSLMYIFAKTTIFIFHNFSLKQKYWYLPLIIGILFIFTYSDQPEFDKNYCERNAILQITHSEKYIVRIDDNCTVLSWSVIDAPEKSDINIKLLKIWRIVNSDKLYYQTTFNK